MEGFEAIENVIASLDYILDSKRKRHIAGGILLSASLLFGGLALTVITITGDNDNTVINLKGARRDE
ncbi:MAG: histidine kinase [Lachnospiraceae bacterium]|nr:histidine kinase [Lachnospiraceae bacterium]